MKKLIFSILSFLFLHCSVLSQNPELWGTMQLGGSLGVGTIIKINGDASGFAVVHNMQNGSPWCTLLPSGSNLLHGVTVSGGTNSLGSIFKYEPSSGIFTTLYSLDSLTGYYSKGKLTLANNNILYGLASNGGINDEGTLFSFNPISNTFLKIHDFDYATSGQFPNGSVIQASNNKLYGMNTTGGINLGGVIFSYDISSNNFTVVHDFTFLTGWTPFGNLLEASNGLLYGMAFGGGVTGHGVIFSFDPSNNNYTVLHNFNGVNGSAPYSSLIQGNNNILYGNTSQGGALNKGVIFSFNLSGNVFTKLHEYVDSTGSSPWGGVMQASNGVLYGMTASGGINNLGTIYSYNLSTGTYTKMHDGSFAQGAIPYADLIEFYGPTSISEPTTNFQLKIYPNPTHDKIFIKNENLSGIFNFQIFDVTGRKVYENLFSDNLTELILNLPGGIYSYMINGEQIIQSGKLIIE